MKNNIKKSRFWEMLKQGLKSFFTKNIAIKVLSLMFAILLWGYGADDAEPSPRKDCDGCYCQH